MKQIFMMIFFVFSMLNVSNLYASETHTEVVVPFGPGGGTDIIYRRLEKFLQNNQQVSLIPVYKPGANGILGMNYLFSKTPQDNVIGIFTFDTIAHFQIAEKQNINPNNVLSIQKNIFGIISRNNKLDNLIDQKVLKVGYLLISQKVIFEVALNALKYKGEVIYVPYKNGSEMAQNVISGDLDMAMTSLGALIPVIQSGRVNLIAIDTDSIMDEFPNATPLGKISKDIPRINKGSSIILSNNASDEYRRMWANIVLRYQNDPVVLQEMKNTYSMVVTRTYSDTVRDINHSMSLIPR